jgi:dihydrofolate reductase
MKIYGGFMRKMNVFENISLDGFFAGPNGEIDWFVAHPGNREENEYAIDSAELTGTLLFGRVTYELRQATGQPQMRRRIAPFLLKG